MKVIQINRLTRIYREINKCYNSIDKSLHIYAQANETIDAVDNCFPDLPQNKKNTVLKRVCDKITQQDRKINKLICVIDQADKLGLSIDLLSIN